MYLAEKLAMPEPKFLYTAVNVQGPGVRRRASTVALARTALLPNTRSEFASEGTSELCVAQLASD